MDAHKGAGLNHDPAYRRSADVPMAEKSMGIKVRPATYTNKSGKGSGIDNKASWDKKGNADLHV